MKNSIEKYIKRIDKLLMNKRNTDWHEVMHEHMDKINFYQHERLVHLIVIMLVSIITVLLLLYSLIHAELGVLLLLIIFIILLVPYLFHYYFLENNVQKMYEQYDKIKKIMK